MAWTLSAELQAEILRLHDAGYSYRQIERKIRVARATVSKIVRRGRVIPPPERVPGQMRRVLGTCPYCRCRVMLPCLACSLSRRAIYDPNGLHDDLGLNLAGDDLARYQEIRESHFGKKKD